MLSVGNKSASVYIYGLYRKAPSEFSLLFYCTRVSVGRAFFTVCRRSDKKRIEKKSMQLSNVRFFVISAKLKNAHTYTHSVRNRYFIRNDGNNWRKQFLSRCSRHFLFCSLWGKVRRRKCVHSDVEFFAENPSGAAESHECSVLDCNSGAYIIFNNNIPE